jgi:hypothetical protein
MDTTSPDPLDRLWPADAREAAREGYRAEAMAAADATIATVPAHLLESFRPDVYRASVVADWLKTFDSFLERARAILGAPEACGREWLARRLVLGSNHSSAAAILILRGANAGVATLPAGAARAARLATMRRAVSMEAAS